MDKYHNWEEVYVALQSQPYDDVLDVEFESDRFYELPWMIKYFIEKGDQEKADFLIDLEEKIESEKGRKLSIGDKFILDTELVKCIVEIIDFDEKKTAYIEYSEIEYKTGKKEIPVNFDIFKLKRKY
jgi:hypothetical protein